MRVWRRVGMESRERWMEGRGERTGEKRGQDRTGEERRGEGREEGVKALRWWWLPGAGRQAGV